MDVNGCFYAKEEASIQEDIKILEKLANRTYKIDKDGWETAVCSIDEQLAIRNIIARNKELEEKVKILSNHNYYIEKSKIEEEFERMTSHANCFNLGDMNDLLDRILN